MREEELSNVKFVKSPYTVDLSNTKKYFVPGASFSVVVRSISPTVSVCLHGKGFISVLFIKSLSDPWELCKTETFRNRSNTELLSGLSHFSTHRA